MKRIGKTIGLAVIALALCGCREEQAREATHSHADDFWQVDVAAALQQAASENKYIIMNISGSAWCRWCIVLENEVFSSPVFMDYARENWIGIVLDFDRTGRAVNPEFAAHHEQLLSRYQIQGFPTVLVLNPQGRVIERTGYRRGGAEAYLAYLQDIIQSDQKK